MTQRIQINFKFYSPEYYAIIPTLKCLQKEEKLNHLKIAQINAGTANWVANKKKSKYNDIPE